MNVRWREPQSDPVVLAFAGDTMPGVLDQGGAAESEGLVRLLRSCGLVMANLESPLTTAASAKTGGSSFQSTPSSVLDLERLNISLVTLANNHIMDRGLAGLEETLSVLAGHHIAGLGAGRDIVEAARPYVWESADLKMAFLAASYKASDVSSTASRSAAGANPLLLAEMEKAISGFKEQGYVVCVSYHGGAEFFRFPCPKRRALFRSLAGSGADIVIGHHAHLFQGVERVGQKLIAHGLGNLVMTSPHQRAHRGTEIGLLLLIEVDRAGPLGYGAKFVYHDRDRRTLSLVSGDAEARLLDMLTRLSKPFDDERAYIREWRRDCCRVLMSLDESKKIPLLRRLSKAVRNAWSSLRPAREEKGAPAIGDGWRYACSKREWTREGIRGIPLMFGAPRKFLAR